MARKRRPFKEGTSSYRENATTLTFGKYKGQKVLEIAMQDPAYLFWIIENKSAFTESFRLKIKDKLASVRPEEMASYDACNEQSIEMQYEIN